MIIKEQERKNYDEEYIKNTILRDLKQIEENVIEYGEIYGSTVKSAEMLYNNLKFFYENILER